MSCKISKASTLNNSRIVLNFASIQIKFELMFHIKFCVKCDWNFRSFFFEDIWIHAVASTAYYGNLEDNAPLDL